MIYNVAFTTFIDRQRAWIASQYLLIRRRCIIRKIQSKEMLKWNAFAHRPHIDPSWIWTKGTKKKKNCKAFIIVYFICIYAMVRTAHTCNKIKEDLYALHSFRSMKCIQCIYISFCIDLVINKYKQTEQEIYVRQTQEYWSSCFLSLSLFRYNYPFCSTRADRWSKCIWLIWYRFSRKRGR